MRKLHFFAPVIGLSAITMAFMAPTISDYMSDTNQLEIRLQTCLDEVADPGNDMRCINASAAATRHWQIEVNAVVLELNEKNAELKSLVEKCTTSRCYAKIAESPVSDELEAVQRTYQKLQAAKPPVWTAS